MKKVLSCFLILMILITLLLSVQVSFAEPLVDYSVCTLTGKITSPDGEAIPGATVTLSNGKTATTDEEGVYKITISKDETVSVTASCPEFGTRTISGVNFYSKGNALWQPRKPTFTFSFDDAPPPTFPNKKKFDKYGFKCAFVVIANRTDGYETYKKWESEGYEIMCHSIDYRNMSGGSSDGYTSDEERVAAMRLAKQIMTDAGLTINGWVPPQSTMKLSILDDLLENFNYVLGRAVTDEPYHVQHSVTSLTNMATINRYYLENFPPEETFANFKEAIEKKHFFAPFGHAFPQGYMDEVNMKAYLDFLKPLYDAGEIDILTPQEAVNKYFRSITCDIQFVKDPLLAVSNVDINQANSICKFTVSAYAPGKDSVPGKFYAVLLDKKGKVIDSKISQAAANVTFKLYGEGKQVHVYWLRTGIVENLKDKFVTTGFEIE